MGWFGRGEFELPAAFTFEFCTLFDQGFLSRGIALIRSLERHFPSFRIHVLCLDPEVERVLSAMADPRVCPVALSELESARPALLEAKAQRTRREYCWTLTAPGMEHFLRTRGLSHLIYLDADIWFVNPDSQTLARELEGCSVYITPHHYARQYDQSEKGGIYCVQFVFIRNDEQGRKILENWAHQCIEWCFDRQEPGRFGDQKYLDAWPSLSPAVRVSADPGLGLAPWSAVRFEVESQVDSGPVIRDAASGRMHRISFFHFHGLKVRGRRAILSNGYHLSQDLVSSVYFPYLEELFRISESVLGREHREAWKFSLRERVWRVLFPSSHRVLNFERRRHA